MLLGHLARIRAKTSPQIVKRAWQPHIDYLRSQKDNPGIVGRDDDRRCKDFVGSLLIVNVGSRRRRPSLCGRRPVSEGRHVPRRNDHAHAKGAVESARRLRAPDPAGGLRENRHFVPPSFVHPSLITCPPNSRETHGHKTRRSGRRGSPPPSAHTVFGFAKAAQPARSEFWPCRRRVRLPHAHPRDPETFRWFAGRVYTREMALAGRRYGAAQGAAHTARGDRHAERPRTDTGHALGHEGARCECARGRC